MCASYHVIHEAVSLRELKATCEDKQLMTLSDDDDGLTLHCSVSQQVSKCYTVSPFSQYIHMYKMALVIIIDRGRKLDPKSGGPFLPLLLSVPFPPLPFSSLPFPAPLLPFPVLPFLSILSASPPLPPNAARRSGERCKLPQRDPGGAPAANVCILSAENVSGGSDFLFCFVAYKCADLLKLGLC